MKNLLLKPKIYFLIIYEDIFLSKISLIKILIIKLKETNVLSFIGKSST